MASFGLLQSFSHFVNSSHTNYAYLVCQLTHRGRHRQSCVSMCLSSVTYLTVRELVQGTCHKVYKTRNHLHEYRNELKSLVKKGITSSANDNIFLAETREVRSGGKYIFLRFIMICCTSESLTNRYVGSSYVVLFWATHAKKGNFSRININSTVRKKINRLESQKYFYRKSSSKYLFPVETLKFWCFILEVLFCIPVMLLTSKLIAV